MWIKYFGFDIDRVIVAADESQFYPEVVELIKKMKDYGIKMFNITSFLRKDVGAYFKRAGIEKCFEFIVSAEDVSKSKPDPEAYLKALKMLNKNLDSKVKPYNCIVSEDSPEGILSAKTAGFYTIGFLNTFKEEDLWSAGADLVFDKLDISIYNRLKQMKKRPSSKLELLDIFSDFLPD